MDSLSTSAAGRTGGVIACQNKHTLDAQLSRRNHATDSRGFSANAEPKSTVFNVYSSKQGILFGAKACSNCKFGVWRISVMQCLLCFIFHACYRLVHKKIPTANISPFYLKILGFRYRFYLGLFTKVMLSVPKDRPDRGLWLLCLHHVIALLAWRWQGLSRSPPFFSHAPYLPGKKG